MMDGLMKEKGGGRRLMRPEKKDGRRRRRRGRNFYCLGLLRKEKKNKDIAVGKSMGEQKDGMQKRHGGHRAIMLPGSIKRGGPWGGDLEQ